jgi:phosphoribosylglycinamide formyltransferase 1
MVMRIRIGVLASGGGSNLQAIVDACESGDIAGEVVLVISDQAEAGALDRARKHGIESVHVAVPKTGTPGWGQADRQMAQMLAERQADLVVMAGYMRKVGAELLGAFRQRVMNIHPGLLPAFPGVHVQWDAADYGVKIAGATVHFADEHFDHGPVIIQAAVPVLPGDSGQELADRILAQEHRIYPQAVKWFAEGRLRLEGRKVKVLDGPLADETAALVSPPLEDF